MTYKGYFNDGDNLVPYLTGQSPKSPRESFFYINDDQQLVGLRYDNWKLVFMGAAGPGNNVVWANPFTNLRVPKIFNLRTIYTSVPISRRTPITIGFLTMPSFLSRRRITSESFC